MPANYGRFLVLLLPMTCCAQEGQTGDCGARAAEIEASEHQAAKQMNMECNSMNMQPENFIEEIIHHGTSGTSAQPNSTPIPMLMTNSLDSGRRHSQQLSSGIHFALPYAEFPMGSPRKCAPVG
jgi:hypothetical protein